MRGGSLQALKEILGHADLKMTLRYATLPRITSAGRWSRPKPSVRPSNRAQKSRKESRESLPRCCTIEGIVGTN